MPTNISRTRRRLTPAYYGSPFYLGYYQNWSVPNQRWSDPYGHVLRNPGSYPSLEMGQCTVDETHAGPPYLTGGPFSSIRVKTCVPPLGKTGNGVYMRRDNLARYVGNFGIPDDDDWGGGMSMNSLTPYLATPTTHYPSMAGWGDKAYSRSKPKLEKAGAGVFLAELRDAPRMIRGTSEFFHDIWKGLGGNLNSKTMGPKKVSDHFLNHQFGWIPFLSDLRKFYNAFDQADNHIHWLVKQNGQWSNRRVTLKSDITRERLSINAGFEMFPDSGVFSSPWSPWYRVAEGPYWEVFEEVHTSITASGKFRYYRPEFDETLPDHRSALNSMKRQLTLYGARINPSNIYKATPWTWAIDWVSNLGDLVDRANDSLVDSVATQYLFVMHHQKRIRRYVQHLPFSSGHVQLQFVRIVETKQRQEGTSPYGFSLTLGDLTPRQFAIAGALGISRYF